MDPWVVLRFVTGLALLVVGAEALVRGASRLAIVIGVSPLVVGLTVVAYGTSAPEIAVSVRSVMAGTPELLLGNVVGSNICNVLLVLGLSAMMRPLGVARRLVRIEVPLMIAVSVAVYILAWQGRSIGRWEGMALVTAAVAYTAYTVIEGRRGGRERDAEIEAYLVPGTSSNGIAVVIQLALIAIGLLCLMKGADWLVESAVLTARALGLSELVIGLTVIAVGTSLPEVATAVVAALRGQTDIAVGNVVGSNLLNLLAVLGIAGTIAPSGIPVPDAAVRFDMPVMIACSVACLPIFFTGERISRWEGALFFGYYLAYLLFLGLQATQHDALPAFSRLMVLFVVPISAVTLLVLFFHSLRRSG